MLIVVQIDSTEAPNFLVCLQHVYCYGGISKCGIESSFPVLLKIQMMKSNVDSQPYRLSLPKLLQTCSLRASR